MKSRQSYDFNFQQVDTILYNLDRLVASLRWRPLYCKNFLSAELAAKCCICQNANTLHNISSFLGQHGNVCNVDQHVVSLKWCPLFCRGSPYLNTLSLPPGGKTSHLPNSEHSCTNLSNPLWILWSWVSSPWIRWQDKSGEVISDQFSGLSRWILENPRQKTRSFYKTFIRSSKEMF